MDYIHLTGDSHFVHIVGDWIRAKGARLVQDPDLIADYEEDGTQFTKAHYSHGDTIRVTVMPENYDLLLDLPPGSEDRPWPPDWPLIADNIISINNAPGDWDERFIEEDE